MTYNVYQHIYKIINSHQNKMLWSFIVKFKLKITT